MSTYFISDLHLDPATPARNQAFAAFLKQLPQDTDALYILGDFFEVWIGDDDQTEFSQLLAAALKQITQQGIPVFFMVGNHDFLVGEHFLKPAGVQPIPDPTVITLYGKATLLTHGDKYCIHDKRYQRFRKIIRSPIIKKCLTALPLARRQAIAQTLRQKSKHDNNRKPLALMDVDLPALLTACEHYETELIIHGHTHIPTIEHLYLNDKSLTKVVLAEWEDTMQVLSVNHHHHYRLNNKIHP